MSTLRWGKMKQDLCSALFPTGVSFLNLSCSYYYAQCRPRLRFSDFLKLQSVCRKMSSKNRLLKIQFQLRHSGLVKVRKLSLANDVKNLSEIKGLIRNLLDADLQDDFDLEYLDGEEKVMIGSDQELQLLWQVRVAGN